MCGPHFCSMKITEDVRDYAREPRDRRREGARSGLDEKAREFREKGSTLYPGRILRAGARSTALKHERPASRNIDAGRSRTCRASRNYSSFSRSRSAFLAAGVPIEPSACTAWRRISRSGSFLATLARIATDSSVSMSQSAHTMRAALIRVLFGFEHLHPAPAPSSSPAGSTDRLQRGAAHVFERRLAVDLEQEAAVVVSEHVAERVHRGPRQLVVLRVECGGLQRCFRVRPAVLGQRIEGGLLDFGVVGRLHDFRQHVLDGGSSTSASAYTAARRSSAASSGLVLAQRERLQVRHDVDVVALDQRVERGRLDLERRSPLDQLLERR